MVIPLFPCSPRLFFGVTDDSFLLPNADAVTTAGSTNAAHHSNQAVIPVTLSREKLERIQLPLNEPAILLDGCNYHFQFPWKNVLLKGFYCLVQIPEQYHQWRCFNPFSTCNGEFFNQGLFECISLIPTSTTRILFTGEYAKEFHKSCGFDDEFGGYSPISHAHEMSLFYKAGKGLRYGIFPQWF